MARAYSASLGCIALIICVVRGLFAGFTADEILGQAIRALVMFAAIGFALAWIADVIIRQSVEGNFRQAVQKLQEKDSS